VSRARLSVTVITRNEEERIRTCLESVAWADELVVVDAESDDKTVAIARDFTDWVIVRPWPGFAAQKNFALERAHGDWTLSLDADETVSSRLRTDIERVLAGGGDDYQGYAVPRRNIVWGRWMQHGGLSPDWQIRLVRRGHGRFVDRPVHESIAVEGRVGRLAGHLEHRSFRDVADFIARHNRYSTLAAEALVAGGAGVRAIDVLARPVGRFVSMYILRAGFRDGWRGFLVAALYAYYVAMRSAKALEKTRA